MTVEISLHDVCEIRAKSDHRGTVNWVRITFVTRFGEHDLIIYPERYGVNALPATFAGEIAFALNQAMTRYMQEPPTASPVDLDDEIPF